MAWAGTRRLLLSHTARRGRRRGGTGTGPSWLLALELELELELIAGAVPPLEGRGGYHCVGG